MALRELPGVVLGANLELSRLVGMVVFVEGGRNDDVVQSRSTWMERWALHVCTLSSQRVQFWVLRRCTLHAV